LELIYCRLVQSFCLVDVVPTLSVSNSSERDGVSKFISSSWGLVKLGGCNRVESLLRSLSLLPHISWLVRQAGGALVLLRCFVLGPVSYWFKLVRVIRQPFVVVG
ncbi:unnamed protein product, partial [Brassica napus]